MSVTIEVVSGSINSQSEGSGKSYVFSCPTNSSVRKGCKETYLSSAIKESSSLGSKISLSRGPARRNVLSEVGGTISVAQYSVRDGEILKVFAQGKGGGWNSPMRTAAIFIKVRSGAALNRLHIRVPENVADKNQPWHVTGRFEVLAPDVAEALGVTILRNCQSHHRQSVVDSLFRVEELAGEVSAAPKMGVRQVGEKVMVTMRKRRALDI